MELNLSQVLDKLGVNYATSEQKYAAFKKAQDRRRLLKKTWDENVRTLTTSIINQLSAISDTPIPEKDAALEAQYKTLRDTFDAFDKDGSAELGYEEYVESWKFLNRPGTDEDIKKAFDAIDVDGTGLVEWNEFAFSLMGEKALNFGALADLETLDNLLIETEEVMKGLRDALFESKASNSDRAERNKDMRERLQRMKGEMNSSLNSVIGKVMSVMGQDARDLMTDEQITKVLVATFKKFDTDGSGGLEYPEFQQAFESLGLVASDAELREAFKKVDTDGSGVVDQSEFVLAVKDSRMAELSLNVIVQQMDGSLDGLENIFADYKRKLELARIKLVWT
eukprot:TRINITY_DN258_c0_g1_i3.p1 TRINITY_DN258_c0_g1~~TRINITY_DN258_c0_g1_i3.p1  ORF type:complete len:338 (+),score=92.20 TRINITY_DN258_c0_g1_i3:430-1443(+)